MSRWLARMALCAWLACAGPSRAEPPEPPPEAGDGDYTLEAADSLADQELEVAVGAASRGSKEVRRSQRVSFRGGGTRGTLRDGDDALTGGRVEAPFAGGSLAAGRLAPRWGRGLALGGAGAVWSLTAEDRGARARFRGRSGSGLAWESTHASVLAGSFSKRRIVGARALAGPAALGVLAGGRDVQASASLERDDMDGMDPRSLELAVDRRGRWRAEGSLTREAGDTRLALRVRGGLASFRSLAEPARAGPARALSASASRDLGSGGVGTVRGFGALWSWRAGQPGARAALEVERGLGHHAAFACGAEEQHGARREPPPHARIPGTRQGWWCECRGGSPGARLTLRHELWGARAFARDAVRRAVVARADWSLPFAGRLALTHAVWRVRSGESLYLPEAEADRLVLRATSGAGSRTRAELRLPLATGSLRLGLTLVTGGARTGSRPPAWTVEWSRRSHLASPRDATPSPSEARGHAIRGENGPADHGRVVRHARTRQGARGAGPERRSPGDR